MKKRELVRGGMFDLGEIWFLKNENEEIEARYYYTELELEELNSYIEGDGWGGDAFGNLPCGCCSCCGCDCYYYDLEDDEDE